MKHIKLFEGFESKLISSTLSFIKNDANKFLKIIKEICDLHDVELSKLNDDMFKYMRFSNAFDYNLGKFEKRAYSPLIKFWFDIDGNLLSQTGITNVSEVKIPRHSEVISDYEETAGDPNLYQILGRINYEDLKALPGASFVCFKPSRNFFKTEDVYEDAKPIVAYHFSARGKNILIQNKYSDGRNKELDYEVLGRGCAGYEINGNYDYDYMMLHMQLTKYIKDSDNLNVALGDRTVDKFSSTNKYVEKFNLDKASFAIILNIDTLLGLPNKQKKIDDRMLSKKDALAFEKNIDIKNKNIDRYLSKIIENSTKDLAKTKNIFRNLLKDKTIYLLFTENFEFVKYINALIINYYIALEGNKGPIGNTHVDDLLDKINKTKSKITITKERTDQNLSSINDHLTLNIDKIIASKKDMSSTSKYGNILIIMDDFEKLSKIIFDKLMENKFETIYDLEIFYQHIIMIKSIISRVINNNYLRHISNHARYALDSLNDFRSMSDFYSSMSRINDTISRITYN